MTETGLSHYLTLRKTCTLLIFLLGLGILSLYIASERQQVAYYIPDITFIDENPNTRERWQESTVNKEVKKDTPRQKQNDLTSSTVYRSSSSKSSAITKSGSNSAQQALSSSSTAFSSSSSPSSASLSSVSSSGRTGTEIGSPSESSGHSDSSNSQTLNHGFKRIIKNGIYIKDTQDFNPVTINLNKTSVPLRGEINKMNIVPADKKEKGLETIEEIHNARIRRIKEVCNKKELFTNMAYKGVTRKIFYGSQNYNFTYCKVPKSGSTFWTKAFGILRFGVDYGDVIFKLARGQVHTKTGDFVKETSQVIRDKSRTILVSRDPFSRLFSAYIDKSFLLIMTKLNYRIRQIPEEVIIRNNSCPTDLTFQEFLDWIISEGKGGKSLNRHWSPIVSLCLPCDVNSFILVKQETFGTDVEYALKTVGVDKEKLDYITPALHDHRAELSLPGIIDTLFNIANNSIVKHCLGHLKYSRRIWISLQIQGFIDDHAEFPVEKFYQTNFINRKYFTSIVLQTLRKFPMTSDQRRRQRLRYLYQAYQAIRPETIKGINELYKQDFELFGYSKMPPTESVDKR